VRETTHPDAMYPRCKLLEFSDLCPTTVDSVSSHFRKRLSSN